MKFPFQRIQDQLIWRAVQGDMARTLDVAHSEIRDRLQRWDEMGITLLFRINFGRMRTRWKGKFVNFAMEQCFSTCSVLETERKICEDEAAMGQWGIEGGTTMRSKDWDHDLVQEEVEGNWGNKGEDTLKMIFIHMSRLQKLQDGPSSPSTPSIMLSMGGFCGQGRKISWSKIITVATRCSWFFFHA